MNITEPGRLADFIASSLSTISTAVKQEVLETLDIRARLDTLNRILIKELEVLELGSKIQSQVQSEVGKNQREYFLREQMKAIQKELGEGDDQTKDIEELDGKDRSGGHAGAGQERGAARARSPGENAGGRRRVYGVADVPRLAGRAALEQAQRRGDRSDADQGRARRRPFGPRKGEGSHHRVPRRPQAEPEVKGPILCFVGPPGVGKTSLAKSIARSLGRKFVRVSLGGMRDEAEIRGHRRTYIGALPGQIIQGLRRAETKNPVFILDEIDKLGSDFRGDPSSALLEVLDPEQNNTFRDHYLDVPFDLSEVLFITTANILDPVPAPLKDRMEVLEIAGYTEEEKLKIAIDHLVDKQVKNHGLTPEYIRFTPEALRQVIRGYTREAGVRNLEREIGVGLPQSGAAAGGRQRDADRHYSRGRRRAARRAQVPRRGDGGAHEGAGRCDRSRLDAGRRRGAVHRGVADGGHRLADAHRSAGRRDEGIGAGGAVVAAHAREGVRDRSRTSSRAPKCTCTCRRAPFRKTARRPA